ncbi:glycosyltransferase family 4 protein [Thalassotalea montiporae]
MYPKDGAPYFGIFVKEQVEEIASILGDDKVKLHFVDGKSPFQKYLLSTFGLFKTIKNFKPDILHLHFGLTILPILALIPWLKLKGVKIVLTTHGGDVVGHYPMTRFVTKLAIKLSNFIINVSNETNEIVKEKTDQTTYIPCGITKEFYSTEQLRKPVVVFPSSPSRPEKNYDRFCRIIDAVKKKTAVNFDVALLENLNRNEVADLFRSSTVMLMTSDYEGSPQAVKEAMLCDLPVISTRVGDVPMLLNDYPHCVVDDVDSKLADGVAHWLENEELFRYVEKDKEALSNQAVCHQVINVYRSQLA